MQLDDSFVCYASKKKTVFLFVLCLGFVAMSFWLIFYAHSLHTFDRGIIDFVSIVSILFFGSISFYILTRLRDNEPIIVVDNNGILNRTNAAGKQFIPWTEITGIESAQMKGSRFLLIYVQNPKKYIAAGNRLQRILMRLNAKSFGSPVSITLQSAKCKYNDLAEAIERLHPDARRTLEHG